jgi:hypothetical protein
MSKGSRGEELGRVEKYIEERTATEVGGSTRYRALLYPVVLLLYIVAKSLNLVAAYRIR